MSAPKKNVLLIGGGAVGTIAAVNLEHGGLAEVTAVLRSNYGVVAEKGFTIDSIDHGKLKAWRPTKSTFSAQWTGGVTVWLTKCSSKRHP